MSSPVIIETLRTLYCRRRIHTYVMANFSLTCTNRNCAERDACAENAGAQRLILYADEKRKPAIPSVVE